MDIDNISPQPGPTPMDVDLPSLSSMISFGMTIMWLMNVMTWMKQSYRKSAVAFKSIILKAESSAPCITVQCIKGWIDYLVLTYLFLQGQEELTGILNDLIGDTVFLLAQTS